MTIKCGLDNSFYSSNQTQTTKELSLNIESIKPINNNLGIISESSTSNFSQPQKSTKNIKIRDFDEIDFIEIDLDTENTSIDKFKEIIGDLSYRNKYSSYFILIYCYRRLAQIMLIIFSA